MHYLQKKNNWFHSIKMTYYSYAKHLLAPGNISQLLPRIFYKSIILLQHLAHPHQLSRSIFLLIFIAVHQPQAKCLSYTLYSHTILATLLSHFGYSISTTLRVPSSFGILFSFPFFFQKSKTFLTQRIF
jgi:hypothetical protein